MAGFKSESRPASSRNQWPASDWNAWPVSSESAAIASDHQPRDADDKRQPFADAAPGGAGLATLLAVTLAQVHSGELKLMAALDLLTAKPAKLLNIEAGRIAKGAPADLCLFQPDHSWRVEDGALPGKAQNTPFDGRALEGRVIGTWKNGVRVFG